MVTPHPLTPYPPLIVNAALTGMVLGREDAPHVPLTPEEIVADAIACHDAGASIVHLHARDANGLPDWRHEAYEEIVPAIRRARPDLVICVTTSGRLLPSVDHRADVLRLEGDAKPDMASLTLGSLNFRTGPSVTSIETIEELARRMQDAGVKPELEIFDSGMAYMAALLLERGALEPPLYANLLLGSMNTAPARAGVLAHLVDSLPPGTCWAAAGLGGFQLPMNAMAVFMGGHVRTGLEDNPHLDYAARTPATNVELVERVVDLARTAGRRPAAPAEVRELLALPARQTA
jgi:uncharacterized protein (DUF849 family)